MRHSLVETVPSESLSMRSKSSQVGKTAETLKMIPNRCTSLAILAALK
jgi:hypothetical protein